MVKIGNKSVSELAARKAYFSKKRYAVLNSKIFVLEWSNAQECVGCRGILDGFIDKIPFRKGEVKFLTAREVNNLIGQEVLNDD